MASRCYCVGSDLVGLMLLIRGVCFADLFHAIGSSAALIAFRQSLCAGGTAGCIAACCVGHIGIIGRGATTGITGLAGAAMGRSFLTVSVFRPASPTATSLCAIMCLQFVERSIRPPPQKNSRQLRNRCSRSLLANALQDLIIRLVLQRLEDDKERRRRPIRIDLAMLACAMFPSFLMQCKKKGANSPFSIENHRNEQKERTAGRPDAEVYDRPLTPEVPVIFSIISGLSFAYYDRRNEGQILHFLV